MSVTFKSVLDDIGNTLKKIFVPVNKVIEEADTAVIKGAPLVNLIPGFGTMIEAGANVVAQVEGAAAAADAQSGTGPQKLAMALPIEEQIILNYAIANGLALKSAQSATTITNALVTILNEFGPAAQATASTPAVVVPEPVTK